MVLVDYIWEKFWMLTILEEKPRYTQPWWTKRRIVRCLCDCWNERTWQLSRIKWWHNVWCWCMKWKNKKHWMFWTKIYSVWAWMKKRCKNKGNCNYKNYWGRGIIYCEEREEFENFYEDMGDSYVEGLTLDRIDNDWNYCKENCRWTTMKQQANNRRNNVLYEWITLSQWATRLWVDYVSMWMYYNNHWKDMKKTIKFYK